MKYLEVKVSDDSCSVILFNTLQEAFNNLKEWMTEMNDGEGSALWSTPLFHKATTVQELAEIAEYFYWGENDMKIYHLLVINDDGTQGEELV